VGAATYCSNEVNGVNQMRRVCTHNPRKPGINIVTTDSSKGEVVGNVQLTPPELRPYLGDRVFAVLEDIFDHVLVNWRGRRIVLAVCSRFCIDRLSFVLRPDRFANSVALLLVCG
jgi:hypothetical protein